jgi:hypothetical protein
MQSFYVPDFCPGIVGVDSVLRIPYVRPYGIKERVDVVCTSPDQQKVQNVNKTNWNSIDAVASVKRLSVSSRSVARTHDGSNR